MWNGEIEGTAPACRLEHGWGMRLEQQNPGSPPGFGPLIEPNG